MIMTKTEKMQISVACELIIENLPDDHERTDLQTNIARQCEVIQGIIQKDR